MKCIKTLMLHVCYLRDKSMYVCVCVYIVHGGWDCVSKVEASYRWVRRVSGGLVASRDCFAGEKKVNEDGDVTYVSRISFIYVKYIYIYIYINTRRTC